VSSLLGCLSRRVVHRTAVSNAVRPLGAPFPYFRCCFLYFFFEFFDRCKMLYFARRGSGSRKKSLFCHLVFFIL